MRRLVVIVLLGLFCAPVPAFALEVPSSIVGTSWLRGHLGKPGLSVIEMSSQVSYEFDGHVPGAQPTTKGAWRVDEPDEVYVRRPANELQTLIRKLGVNDGDAVVVYAKGAELDDLLGAAYLVWLFHALGHDNVALLDEGWSGWLAAAGPVSSDTPPAKPGTFVARPDPRAVVDTAEMLAVYKTATVIDGRPATHFAGTEKFPANTKYGRIPGSINQPWPDYIAKDMDGRLYMTSSVPALLKSGAFAKNHELLLTCFGGTGAAMNYVLFRHHGYTNLRLHDAGIRRWNVRDLPLVKD